MHSKSRILGWSQTAPLLLLLTLSAGGPNDPSLGSAQPAASRPDGQGAEAREQLAETRRPVTRRKSHEILLCEAIDPVPASAVPHVYSLPPGYAAGPGYPPPPVRCAVDCPNGVCGGATPWRAVRPLPEFQEYNQGEYVGRARIEHVPSYRLRVDDQLEFVYRVTRDQTSHPYELNVGDQVRVESFTDKNLDRTLMIQPDGTISLPLLGQVRASRHSVAQLQQHLEELYKKYYKVPSIIITPVQVNTKLEDLRYTVSGRSGFGGQVRPGRVTPEGTVALPAVGNVPAQGLTLDEFKHELDQRYAEAVEGIEVTPVLMQRAPRFVFVVGEVKTPGRFPLEGPTTVMQAIALAGSWNVGANINQVVVFRRGNDWHLMATMLDLRAALLGRTPCPADEIWVGDSDLIVVPKSRILQADNFVELVFTKGIYGVFPFSTTYSIGSFSTVP